MSPERLPGFFQELLTTSQKVGERKGLFIDAARMLALAGKESRQLAEAQHV